MNFTTRTFEKLTNSELYAILKLRSEVFVVEQNCVYQDLDNFDQKSIHIFGKHDNEIHAYTRILPPKLYYKEAAIGRVVTSKEIRMDGYGKEIMNYSIALIKAEYASNIRIMAQCYLTRFYADFGFKIEGPEFLEDGIPHVEMLLTVSD
jgi:ElaA protein